MALVTDAWRPYIREPDGEISRRYYELCTLWHLRSALRSGGIWVEHSRRYADPDTYLIPRAEWPSRRLEVIRQTGTPGEGLQRLVEREAALEACMARSRSSWLAKTVMSVSRTTRSSVAPGSRAPARQRGSGGPHHGTPSPGGRVTSSLRSMPGRISLTTLSTLPVPRRCGPPCAASLCQLLAHACNFGTEQMAHSTEYLVSAIGLVHDVVPT